MSSNVIPVEITDSVQAVPIGSAIRVEGVQIPPASGGAQRLDDLTDVDGVEFGFPGQALVKDIDGQWRPASVSGGGGGGEPYVVLQATPAATWSITHPLGHLPQVTVLDAAGNRLMPDLHYGSLNTVTVTHAEPLAGTAILT